MRRAEKTLAAVFDNEAVQALSDTAHPKHQVMLGILRSAGYLSRQGHTVRLLVPTAVRVEAGLSRQAAGTAALNRLQVADVALDSRRADRCADLTRAGAGTTVDVTVAQTAEDEAQTHKVTIFTADVGDLTQLVGHSSTPQQIRIQRI